MVLIDLSKAFDSLCNLTLLSKLYQLGTSNKALQWFHSYLTNREQCIRVGTSLLEPLMVTHGVPQGSILGPMLFSLNMNDLPRVTKFSNIELYVDDKNISLKFCIGYPLMFGTDFLGSRTCCANHFQLSILCHISRVRYLF